MRGRQLLPPCGARRVWGVAHPLGAALSLRGDRSLGFGMPGAGLLFTAWKAHPGRSSLITPDALGYSGSPTSVRLPPNWRGPAHPDRSPAGWLSGRDVRRANGPLGMDTAVGCGTGAGCVLFMVGRRVLQWRHCRADGGRPGRLASEDQTSVWDLETAPPRTFGATRPVRPGGIAGGAGPLSASTDGTLRLWDLGEDHPQGSVLAQGGAMIIAVAVAPDGALAVTASADSSLQVWDLQATSRPAHSPGLGLS